MVTGLSPASGQMGTMLPYSRQAGFPPPLKMGQCRGTAFDGDCWVGWEMLEDKGWPLPRVLVSPVSSC